MELRFLAALTAVLLSGTAFAQAAPDKATADYWACDAARTAAVERIKTALQASGLPYAASMYAISECTIAAIQGAGTVSTEEVKAALAKAGISVEVKPSFPPSNFGPVQNRLKLKLPAPLRVPHGQNLRLELRWFNPTFKKQTLFSGDNALDYVVIDSQGNLVRWKESNLMTLGEMLTPCSLRAFCQSPLPLNIPLNHFNPTLPLEPGRYFLRLKATDLGFAGQTWDDTFPDIPLEILP